MKEVNLPSGEYLLVEIPENTIDIYVADPRYLSFRKSNGERTHVQYIGNWEVIGTANELTWGDKVGIIESENDGSGLGGWWYKIYTRSEIMTKSADKSFESLIKFHSMKPETTLILRKQSKANNI